MTSPRTPRQSVPAVPVSSTGGKETEEAAETGIEALSIRPVGPRPSREELGHRVAEVCLKWSREDDEREGATATWEALNGHRRELYMRVGEALFGLGMVWSPVPSPLPDSETESKWRVAYEQKLADFARETLRTSELIRERDELRRQLAERDETPAEGRYAEGEQVEIYAVGRWEPADICRDYGGDRIEARDWGTMIHTCRREDVRRREVTS